MEHRIIKYLIGILKVFVQNFYPSRMNIYAVIHFYYYYLLLFYFYLLDIISIIIFNKLLKIELLITKILKMLLTHFPFFISN